jgi:hypothetical protein
MVRAEEDRRGAPAQKNVLEQMERGHDIDSVHSSQRGGRMCTMVGAMFCVCVVVATLLLWENLGFGSDAGYVVRPPASVRGGERGRWKGFSGEASLRGSHGEGSRRRHMRRAVSSKRLQERHVKQLLAQRALDLAQKAVISEVAAKYAPASFLAAHRRPEHDAIVDVTQSPTIRDRVTDQVEGELLDAHYAGHYNPIAREVARQLPGLSRTQRNNILEPIATTATRRAFANMAHQADATWVDHGLGENKHAGWIEDQIRGNLENTHPAPPAAHPKRHGAGSSSSGASAMRLPGLGDVHSPEDAAKALERLALTPHTIAANVADANSRSGEGDEGKEGEGEQEGEEREDGSHGASRGLQRTLHAALRSKEDADGLDFDGGNDLHSALERQQKV